MPSEEHHDPVNALAESEATGRTAEIFADIREVMDIPLVTSIWRTLAGSECGLERAWEATRPLFTSGGPQALLATLKSDITFPIAHDEAGPVWAALETEERAIILSILQAYNRSNSLNLLALSALISDAPPRSKPLESATPLMAWPVLPPLLSQTQIGSSDWRLLEEIKHIGASYEKPAMPTLLATPHSLAAGRRLHLPGLYTSS